MSVGYKNRERVEGNRKKKFRREKEGKEKPTLVLTHFDSCTLLRRSVGRHWPLPHDMVSLVNLTHHAHGVLLSLVVLSTTTRRHVILLGGRLLVHHGACDTEVRLKAQQLKSRAVQITTLIGLWNKSDCQNAKVWLKLIKSPRIHTFLYFLWHLYFF